MIHTPVSLRITGDLHEAIIKAANENGIMKSEWLRDAINFYLLFNADQVSRVYERIERAKKDAIRNVIKEVL
jgi:hypothetical protein